MAVWNRPGECAIGPVLVHAGVWIAGRHRSRVLRVWLIANLADSASQALLLALLLAFPGGRMETTVDKWASG